MERKPKSIFLEFIHIIFFKYLFTDILLDTIYVVYTILRIIQEVLPYKIFSLSLIRVIQG